MKDITPIELFEPSKEHIEMIKHFKNIEKQITKMCAIPEKFLQSEPKSTMTVAILEQVQFRMSIILTELFQNYLNEIIKSYKKEEHK